jgi:hypothetical protein
MQTNCSNSQPSSHADGSCSSREQSRILIVRQHELVAIGFCLTPAEWQTLRHLITGDSKNGRAPEGSSKNLSKSSQNGAFSASKQPVFERKLNRSTNWTAANQP